MVPRMIAALLVAQVFAAGTLTLGRTDDVLDVGLIPAWGALGFIEVAAVTALAWHFGIVPEWTVPDGDSGCASVRLDHPPRRSAKSD
jgi:hypothetical protein